MNKVNDCSSGVDMSDVWAVIVCIVIVMVIYGYVASVVKSSKRNKARSSTVPKLKESIVVGTLYNVYLSDGRVFQQAEILGSVEGEDAEHTFANWEGLIVLKKEGGKKVFVKKNAIRFVEEA